VSPDKKRTLEVVPSALGRATIFDKDILLFIVGQIAEGINLNREDIVGREMRTVRFKMADYLKATGKGSSGFEYARAENSLRKLRGTSIHTNIATGNKIIKKDFGLIEEWTTVERSDWTSPNFVAIFQCPICCCSN
jgi:plasmid replication initiation protein